MSRTIRTLLWTAIVLGSILLLLVTSFFSYTYVVKREFEREIARLRDAGRPTRLVDLENRTLLELNAAPLLESAKAVAEKLRSEINAILDPHKARWDKLSDSEWAAIETVLGRFPNLLETLEDISNHESVSWDYDYSQYPDTIPNMVMENDQTLTNYHLVLTAHVQLCLKEREEIRALNYGLLQLQLVRKSAEEPFLSGSLHRYRALCLCMPHLTSAIHTGPTSVELLKKIDAELAHLESTEPIIYALETELLLSLELMRSYFLGSGEMLTGWWIYRDLRRCVQIYEEVRNLVEAPLADAKKRIAELSEQGSSMTTPLSMTMLPSLEKHLEIWDGMRGQIRGLRKLIRSRLKPSDH